MAAPTPVPTILSLKLLIDPKSNKLLFAEAGKGFVDFLFYIMSLPIGTVTTLLGKQGTTGCTGNIYNSIENLGNSYMSAAKKDSLLKPMLANYNANVARLFPTLQCSVQINLYRCVNNENCHKNVTNDANALCPSCQAYMNQNVNFMNPANKPFYSRGGGFVKEASTFMITDDLVVRPISTESILALLNEFNIKDMSGLEVKVVGVGINEAVELLRSLMLSKTVLTDVFLAEK